MGKELTIIVCVPKDLAFQFEVELTCESLRQIGLSKYLQILYEKDESYEHQFWGSLEGRYSEVKFFGYNTDAVKNLIKLYPPIIRPNLLKQHWINYPELKDNAIYYIDSDLLHIYKGGGFKAFKQHLLENKDDDINYCSKTPYISAKYFESKVKDILPFRSKEFSERDILYEACRMIGVDKQVVIDNEENTGGCQWLLKNIDYRFWEKVEKDCIALNLYFKDINNRFFSSENKGFQTWAISDMCSLLWNVWRIGETECPNWLNFTWATTPIEEYNTCYIYHNSGVSNIHQKINGEDVKFFCKTDFRFRANLITPFQVTDWIDITDKYCNKKYVEFIQSFTDPIVINKNVFKY